MSLPGPLPPAAASESPRPLSVMIVDDAPLARQRLRALVEANAVPACSDAATSCSRRRRSATFTSAMPVPGRPGISGKVLVTTISAMPRCTRVRTTMRPPATAGSMPWRTAFSTRGCKTSGGSTAWAAAGSRSQTTCRRSPKRNCSIAR